MSQEKMIEGSPLTSRYKLLQKAEAYCSMDDDHDSVRQTELDLLYQQIVSLPVRSLADAIDKLAFADHCLMEEHDVKEASNLIRAVSAALLILHRASASPEKIRRSRDSGNTGFGGERTPVEGCE